MADTLKGVNRRLMLPPCRVSADDLRKLATKMDGYAKEAADREVAGFTKLETQSAEEFEKFKSEVRDLLRLTVRVQSDTDEWRSGPAADVLTDDLLPDVVAQITYDSAFLYRARTNGTPINGVLLNLDFRRRAVFDFRNSS